MRFPHECSSQQLLLRSRRRQLTEEAVDVGGEFGMALGEEDVDGGEPAPFDGLSGFAEP